MDDKRISYLEDLRNSRNGSNSAFLEFVEGRRYHDDYVFAFYEGEDGKYYNQRIRTIIGEKFIHISAGNKNKVLTLMKMIKTKKEYQDVNVMFFVDRDMDFDMEEYADNDLYVTPCYSIENLYVDKKCIGLILENEFGMNIYDNDYINYIKLFEEYYDIFCKLMIEFNALILLRKENESICENVNVSDTKTSNLVDIDIVNGVTLSSKYEDEINKLKVQLKVSVSDVECAKQRILKYGQPCEVFRGKNQFDFLVKYVQLLSEKKKEIFERTPRCVSINPNQNSLSTLSMYAITPPCLEEFIMLHKNKKLVLI